MSKLEVRDVTVTFDGTTVLDSTSLAVDDGEIIALLGPSGSGKSTLLRVIAGIVAPDRGAVLIDGADVTTTPTHLRRVGMVFQDNQLFAHRSTLDNVAFGLKMAGIGRAERRATAADWLDRVGLAGFGPRGVTELSGGEAKRVALARTLANDPQIILADEPTGNLDPESRENVMNYLSDFHNDGRTIMMVTHDQFAAGFAQRTLRLVNGVVSDETEAAKAA
jgi:ABC-type Fe3+/spermidine/putrescine transport system ATPase subunit